MTSIKLYDLTVGDFPIDVPFRSLQVFKCNACGALTNRTYWASCFMGGARVECPNEKEGWHQRIKGLTRPNIFEERPKVYEEMVEKEVGEIRRSVSPAYDLLGDPIRDWLAKAILHDGYVVDGVSCWPGGKKKMAMWSGQQLPTLFPPIIDNIFESVIASYPQELVSLARRYLQARYLFAQRPESGVIEVFYQSSGLAAIHTEMRSISVSDEQSMLDQQLEEIHRKYRVTYWQWEAEEHLRQHGYLTRHVSP